MDELLQKALERRGALRKELEALEKFIQGYQQVLERRAPSVSNDLFSFTTTKRRRGRAAAIAAVMDDAEKLILAARRPLSRSVLLRELERAGHTIEGGDKSKVLGTNLWRSKRFHNLKGAGYWPISEPIPEEYARLAPRPSALLDN